MNKLTRYNDISWTKINYFFPKFCEPPNRRMDSIKSSWDNIKFVLKRWLLLMDVDRRLSPVLFDGAASWRIVDIVVSPLLPIRRTVRYSVTAFPNGFGATIGGGGGGGDGCWDIGEARANNCLRSLSTVT